ncbi:MAG: phosphoenolpyruvate--protein phosphotransferase [Rhodothermia bacterium]
MDSLDNVRADNVLTGSGASPGIAVGKAYRFEKTSFEATRTQIERAAVSEELTRLDRSLDSSERDLLKIAAVARDQLGTESARLFEAQALMLHDPTFKAAVIDMISNELLVADYAVQSVMEEHRARLEASTNRYLRERAHDMADVQMRLVRHLQQGRVLSRIDEKRIVVATSLSAADLILFVRQKLLGCVLDYGAETSHVAIMARALGIPVVMGLEGRTREIESGVTLAVDGVAGTVVVDPSPEQVDVYRAKRERLDRSLEESAALAPILAETTDSVRVELHANLEFEEELPHLDFFGAEGVGLFRTEMLFMSEPSIPDEDEQTRLYRRIVRRVSPRMTTFRLLDLGGDKVSTSAPQERNPDLGWRGMRVLLDTPDLLIPQLRALLRAGSSGPLRILLPMVTNVSELRQLKQVKADVEAELRAEGKSVRDSTAVGVMIEIPSAAIQADHFAREADFMSVGTNDLTQYTLAVERSNELVGHRYSSLHPAVLHLIKRTLDAGALEGTPTSLCGELAGYAPAAPVLIGLGYRELSLSPMSLPEIKQVIRGCSIVESEELARTCLEAVGADEVRSLVRRWFEDRPGLLPSDKNET